MNIFENIKSSIKSVFSNKMRALLTMLGIIIGIGSVITITSIGQGSQAAISSNFDQMGVGRLTVSQRGGRNITQSDRLTSKDYDLLREYDELKYVTGVYTSNLNIKLLDPRETKSATITGIIGDYSEIYNPTLLYGRYINENDIDMGNKVVVINDTTAEKVFGYSDPRVLGQKVSIKTNRGTQSYTVIGILENANASMESMYGDQFPETVYMPLTTLQRLVGAKYLSQIVVVVNNTDIIDDVAQGITDKLDEFHGTTEKYYVQNMMTMMETINETMGMVTMLISCIAGISLLVGGIGVMNIMLVTVTERTREIGIRKSIGAKKGDIRVQFLIEAVILTGIGGILGLMLGYGGGNVAGKLMNITPLVSSQAIILAVSVSTLIGIVFGVYPANKAAKLDPIEALRYE